MTNSRENILIVDDEEMLRWILNRKLTKEGYRCEEAGGAEQAMEILKNKPSELVVLDINMPGKPGTELLPEISTEFPDTAVVMASGVTDTSVIARCIKDGAQDYICKPYSLDEVLLSVTRALGKRRLELEIREHQQQVGQEEPVAGIRNLFLTTIEALIRSLEANDKYTAGHSQAVTDIAWTLGKQLGLPHEHLDDLRWGALLHDVGKIAVDPAILNKPGELTTEEYRHIMVHATIGPRLVRPFANDRVVEIISHHHDHYDGSGFGQTVSGRDIPLGARIVAVADAFNAMTSDRPYRAAMSKKDALDEIQECSGTQFDPTVSGRLLDVATCEKI